MDHSDQSDNDEDTTTEHLTGLSTGKSQSATPTKQVFIVEGAST